MDFIRHAARHSTAIPRIATRRIVTPSDGATTLEMWEQFMPPGGFIPSHYHECEEIITIVSGSVRFTLGDDVRQIDAGADGVTTIFIAPRVVHHAENDGTAEVHLLAVFAEVEPRIFLADGTLVCLPWQTTS